MTVENQALIWYNKQAISKPFLVVGKEQKIMAEKRKDNKGRLLHQGESQRRDGRYCYQYIYRWRLIIAICAERGRFAAYTYLRECASPGGAIYLAVI